MLSTGGAAYNMINVAARLPAVLQKIEVAFIIITMHRECKVAGAVTKQTK
jgi:hypothetical protein